MPTKTHPVSLFSHSPTNPRALNRSTRSFGSARSIARTRVGSRMRERRREPLPEVGVDRRRDRERHDLDPADPEREQIVRQRGDVDEHVDVRADDPPPPHHPAPQYALLRGELPATLDLEGVGGDLGDCRVARAHERDRVRVRGVLGVRDDDRDRVHGPARGKRRTE
eukprot:29832-Pelagococcus_subviridis.AAC.3